MKKIFKLIGILLMFVIGVNNVNALQDDYYMRAIISFPSDISSKKGILEVDNSYSDYKTFYQFQSISKENYDKVLELQKKYEEDIKTYMKNKNSKADEVVTNCGFEKEAVMNYCGKIGGPNCVSLVYNEEEITDACKNSLNEYEENFTYGSDVQAPNLSNYLPNIEEKNWIETSNNEFVVSDILDQYQVLYAKVNGTETSGITVSENSVAYSFKLYDLKTYNSEMKDSATINNENNTEVSKDIESSNTITKPVTNVDKQEEVIVKEDTTTEKNPQTGIEKIGISVIVIGLISFMVYIIVKNKKVFTK